MILKYGFAFVMVTINKMVGSHTLTSVTASVVVYVDPRCLDSCSIQQQALMPNLPFG